MRQARPARQPRISTNIAVKHRTTPPHLEQVWHAVQVSRGNRGASFVVTVASLRPLRVAVQPCWLHALRLVLRRDTTDGHQHGTIVQHRRLVQPLLWHSAIGCQLRWDKPNACGLVSAAGEVEGESVVVRKNALWFARSTTCCPHGGTILGSETQAPRDVMFITNAARAYRVIQAAGTLVAGAQVQPRPNVAQQVRTVGFQRPTHGLSR